MVRYPGVRMFCLAVGLVLLGACQDRHVSSESPVAEGRLTAKDIGTHRPARLIFGLTPFLASETVRREFDPLARYLALATGIPIEVQVATSYAELMRDIGNHRAHIAVLSPFAYVRAKREYPGLVLLATHVADGASTYSAYIITRDDNGINNVNQLRGKRFGFVDRTSTSGYLYPLAYLRSLGYEPETFFAGVQFTGNHAELTTRVQRGELDAGATFSTAYQAAKAKNLRILAKTGRIPYDAYCASPRLHHALVQVIRRALLGLRRQSEPGSKILGASMNISGFVAVADDHYDQVRRVVRLVDQTMRSSP